MRSSDHAFFADNCIVREVCYILLYLAAFEGRQHISIINQFVSGEV